MEDYNVRRARDPQKRAQLYKQIDAHSLLRLHQFVAGYIQHPETQLYQIWLSTNGLDLIYVSTRRRQSDAESDVQTLKATLGSQDIYDEMKLEALFKRLEVLSDEKPSPLPDDLVKKIGQAIRTSLTQGS